MGSVRFRLYYEQLAEIHIPVPKNPDAQHEFALVCRRLESVRNSAKQLVVRAERTLDALRREAFLEIASSG
jgi:type I restriction enzyme M protein